MPADLLLPISGERGLASHDVALLARSYLGAWDAFIDLAADVELDAPSRLSGWTGRDVLAHLGAWEDHVTMERLLAEARGTAHAERIDQDARNASVIARHRDATHGELIAALERARDAVADFLASDEAREFGVRRVDSVLGPLPLLAVVGAANYELAVHGLDLLPAGVAAVPAQVLHAGLGSLVDITGALAARQEITATVTGMTPFGGWAFGCRGQDWTTVELPAGPIEGIGVEADAAVLLDVSAGRVAVPPLLVRRELRAHGTAGLMALAPIVEAVPGIPGGAALTTAARYVGGVGRLVQRLPGLG